MVWQPNVEWLRGESTLHGLCVGEVASKLIVLC